MNLSGGLMQRGAIGDENKHLTGDLEFLLFKNVYRRHTNFADETFEQKFNGIPELIKALVAGSNPRATLQCRVNPPRDASVQGQAPRDASVQGHPHATC